VESYHLKWIDYEGKPNKERMFKDFSRPLKEVLMMFNLVDVRKETREHYFKDLKQIRVTGFGKEVLSLLL